MLVRNLCWCALLQVTSPGLVSKAVCDWELQGGRCGDFNPRLKGCVPGAALLQARAVLDKDYVPNFKTAFDHFLVHTGGRAVIEEVEKKLRLDPADVQPSKETLFRYGNTCCAAVFYVLTNMEARVRRANPAHKP